MKPEDAEAALKELIRAIPTDRERVFAYPIKWDAFDAAAATLVPKLSAWVSKKITELLGVDEPTMARAPSVSIACFCKPAFTCRSCKHSAASKRNWCAPLHCTCSVSHCIKSDLGLIMRGRRSCQQSCRRSCLS